MPRRYRRYGPFRFTSVTQLMAANLPVGAMWEVVVDGSLVAMGFVNSSGALYPNPYTNRMILAPELAKLPWTQTIGDGGDITLASATGITMVAEAGSTATGAKLAGISLTGPAMIEGTIEITNIDSAVLNMLAVCGQHNEAGTDDWVAGGFIYSTVWKAVTWGNNYNGGSPLSSSVITATDLSSYTAGGKFNYDAVGKLTSVNWSLTAMADDATDTIRTTAGAVHTATATMAPVDTWNPFFYVQAPTGGLTARLTSLYIADKSATAFWG